MKPKYLVLADGTVFEGAAFGADAESVGELVFTTGMGGYIETLTDPSYAGQIVMQTFPQIGNYGIIPEDFEGKTAVLGYVVREFCRHPSNFRCSMNLDEWLKLEGIPGIWGIDTRAVTRLIREKGVMNAKLCDSIPEDYSHIVSYRVTDAVSRVTCRAEYTAEAENASKKAVLIDYGCKKNIINELTRRGCTVTVVPAGTSAEEILAKAPDGVMLSNGPGVPMVELATKVMTGTPVRELGYGMGLYKTPPYVAVKVPVFSFEKLTDANSYLGPEMKSTGEVLGIGRTMHEALFKGLVSAGIEPKAPTPGKEVSVFISVEQHDLLEVLSLAEKLSEIGMKLYATPDTANAIMSLGIDVRTVASADESEEIFSLLKEGKISYVVYTGAAYDSTVETYIRLHRAAMQEHVPCFTSLDTANVLADIISAGYRLDSTELVDINHMRSERAVLRFAKMEASGDDYIFAENFGGEITCPESLCVSLCDRHYGIGGYGLILLEKSDRADCRMRVYNRDGSVGQTAGNSLRSVGKYLYDNGIVRRDTAWVETESGVKELKLFICDGTVSSVSVNMGRADFSPASLPCTLPCERTVDVPLTVGGREYRVTCVSVGNPHCVVFCDRVDTLPLSEIGPLFENAPEFPERTNTEFVRVVNPVTLKMRVYERGNGETYACGSGACAAAAAAVENGYCLKGEDITVKTRGGDLTVRCTDDGIVLTGGTELIFTGELRY